MARIALHRIALHRLLAATLCLLAAACADSAPFEGLGRAEPGPGPKIVFDLLRKPLPEIPFPNDLATRQDATSPTGPTVTGWYRLLANHGWEPDLWTATRSTAADTTAEAG